MNYSWTQCVIIAVSFYFIQSLVVLIQVVLFETTVSALYFLDQLTIFFYATLFLLLCMKKKKMENY